MRDRPNDATADQQPCRCSSSTGPPPQQDRYGQTHALTTVSLTCASILQPRAASDPLPRPYGTTRALRSRAMLSHSSPITRCLRDGPPRARGTGGCVGPEPARGGRPAAPTARRHSPAPRSWRYCSSFALSSLDLDANIFFIHAARSLRRVEIAESCAGTTAGSSGGRWRSGSVPRGHSRAPEHERSSSLGILCCTRTGGRSRTLRTLERREIAFAHEQTAVREQLVMTIASEKESLQLDRWQTRTCSRRHVNRILPLRMRPRVFDALPRPWRSEVDELTRPAYR